MGIEQILSKSDAAVLLSAITGITGVVVAWMKATDIKDWIKFLILCAISAVGGFLTAYVAGQFDDAVSIVTVAAIIYTFGRGFYYAAFQMLGLERILFPKSAVVNQAKQAATTQIVTKVSSRQSKDVLDPSCSQTLVVDANVVNREPYQVI